MDQVNRRVLKAMLSIIDNQCSYTHFFKHAELKYESFDRKNLNITNDN